VATLVFDNSLLVNVASSLLKVHSRLDVRNLSRSRRSRGTMQSPFAGLHETLTARILASDTLSFEDKMHCEQVCLAWKSLLRCSEPDTSRGIWTKRVDFHISAQAVKDVSLVLDRQVPTMELESGNPRLTTRQQAGLDWLARRAAGISDLRIHALGNPKWTLAIVLLALQKWASTSAPGPGVRLFTGDLTQAVYNSSSRTS